MFFASLFTLSTFYNYTFVTDWVVHRYYVYNRFSRTWVHWCVTSFTNGYLKYVAKPRFVACNSEEVGTDSNFPGFMVVKTTSENSDISESNTSCCPSDTTTQTLNNIAATTKILITWSPNAIIKIHAALKLQCGRVTGNKA